MGLEVQFFVLNSADILKCDQYISQFSKTPLGATCTYLRFTEGMDFQVYGVDPGAVREDQFLKIAAEFSKMIPMPVLAGMIIDNAGFDGAWIYQNGTLTEGFASAEEEHLPENTITDDPVTAGLQVLNLSEVTHGHIYAIVEYCVEPVAITEETDSQFQERSDTQGKFERKVRLSLIESRERYSKYNNRDYRKYKAKGDMNKYFGFAVQRGWSIPFLLSEWKHALDPIQQYCALEDEKLEYDHSQADNEDDIESYNARHQYAFLYLCAERITDAQQILDVADEVNSKYRYFSESKVISAYMLAPERLDRYRRDDIGIVETSAIERGASTEVKLAFVAYINLFYALFSCDRNLINTRFEDYSSRIRAIPKLTFISRESVILSNPRQFYLAFEKVVKHILEGSTEAIDAAWQMLWWHDIIESHSSLSYKCLELFARRCAGEETDLNFKLEFPALAEFLERATLPKDV